MHDNDNDDRWAEKVAEAILGDFVKYDDKGLALRVIVARLKVVRAHGEVMGAARIARRVTEVGGNYDATTLDIIRQAEDWAARTAREADKPTP